MSVDVQYVCHIRLQTLDSNIGRLRAIFHSLWRNGEWDKRLGLGNPAVDKSVKDLLRLVTAEQLIFFLQRHLHRGTITRTGDI